MKIAGVRGALYFLPVVSFAGYLAVAVVPALRVVEMTKVAENSLDYSLQNTARQALFLVTDRVAKYVGKTVVDTLLMRLGDVLAAGTVAVGAWLSLPVRAFALLNLVLVGGWARHAFGCSGASTPAGARRSRPSTALAGRAGVMAAACVVTRFGRSRRCVLARARARETRRDARPDGRDDPPKRPIPDYGNRGLAPTTAGDVALVAARVIVSPLYVVTEYVIRRPLGVVIPAAERSNVPKVLYDFFLFGPDHKAGIVPTFLGDFGLRPSVGLYAFWTDAFVPKHDMVVHGSTWGSDWLAGAVTDRVRFEKGSTDNESFTLAAVTRPDHPFYGVGPRSLQGSEARYGATRVDLVESIDKHAAGALTLHASGGLRAVDFHDGQHLDDDPTLAQSIAEGALPPPPGYLDDYTLFVSGLRVALDSRGKDSGSGVRLEVGGQHEGSLRDGAQSSWVKYGGSLKGSVDLDGHHRVLTLSVLALFVDPMRRGTVIPFTELVTLGGSEPMRAYLGGRMIDRSAFVTALEYRWPVWAVLDGTLKAEFGNVFDAHLDATSPSESPPLLGIDWRADVRRLRQPASRSCLASGARRSNLADRSIRYACSWGRRTMASRTQPEKRRSSARRSALATLVSVSLLAACGGMPRFPLRDALTHDDDERTDGEARRREYVSPFAWDGANQLALPSHGALLCRRPGGAGGERERARRGPRLQLVREPDRRPFHDARRDRQRPLRHAHARSERARRGTWLIDQGKSNGANPGFRVNVPGKGKFLLKTDPEAEPERETGATSIAARIYHAAGYYSPCDSVVYVRRSILKLKPGLTVTDNSGVEKPFDEKALDGVLLHASKRGPLVRMVASRWLPGQTLGPYRYDGTRADDPNDVIPHEDRRELRGARLLAAWTNHFDTREQNTMNLFMRKEDGAKTGPGFVRHYILDLGDCFGSIWEWDSVTRRLGFAYYFDFSYLGEDFVTLGTHVRPWEVARREGGIFAYFSARNFDPEAWKGGYPNPAFLRMQEGDGAWMARIIARFTDDDVAAIARVGDYTKTRVHAVPDRGADRAPRRHPAPVPHARSPLADVHVADDARLCATDLARRTHAAGLDLFHSSSRRYAGWPPGPGEKVRG